MQRERECGRDRDRLRQAQFSQREQQQDRSKRVQQRRVQMRQEGRSAAPPRVDPQRRMRDRQPNVRDDGARVEHDTEAGEQAVLLSRGTRRAEHRVVGAEVEVVVEVEELRAPEARPVGDQGHDQ
jgi:hypothetical protein